MKNFLCNPLVKKNLYWVALSCASLFILCFFTLYLHQGAFWLLDCHAPYSLLPYTFSFMGILWFLHKLSGTCLLQKKDGLWQTLAQALFSCFFAGWSVLGSYFDSFSPFLLSQILSHFFSVLFSLVAFAGGVLFYFLIIRFFWHLGERNAAREQPGDTLCSRFLGKHLYRNCILVLLIFWIPQYLIRFPGAVTYDNWQSIAMYFGATEMTTQHPMLWTILLGALADFGMKINIPWLAPLVICLVHFLLALLLIPYVLSSLKKLGVKKSFLLGSLLFFALIPQLKLYLSTTYNDFLFCLAFLLLTAELSCYLYNRSRFFTEPHHLLLTAVASFATILRYNGFYTMVAVIAVILLRELVLLGKKNAKLLHALFLSAALILPVAGGQVLQGSLNRAYGAKPITNRAILALPIQQSVRCLIAYGEEIPKEDYDALHAVLTWTDEEYAQTYDPRNFDGVKESFRTDASSQELASFIKAWTNLLRRYPKTCLMATAHETYYLFSPLAHNTRYYTAGINTELAMERYQFDATPYNFPTNSLTTLANTLLSFLHHTVVPNLPIVGLFVTQGFYTLLLFAICLRTLFLKDKRVLVLAVALLVTLGITFLGPAVYRHPRYTYILVYCMPILLAMFLKSNTPTEV